MTDLHDYALPKCAFQWLSGSGFESSAIELGLELNCEGYSPRTITSYLSSVAHFAHWCLSESVEIEQVNAACITRFLEHHLPACCCAPRCRLSLTEVRAALHRWSRVVSRLGLIQADRPPYPANIANELECYATYLEQIQGLQRVTQDTRLKYVATFLSHQFDHDPIRVGDLIPADVLSFVAVHTLGLKPGSVKVMCVSLRSYLRFKSMQGTSTVALIASLPKVAQWRLATLPKALTDEEITALLGAYDRTTVGGQRDYAIARCYIDLGLRTAEIVRLRLEDIDWHHGVVNLHGKGRRVDSLPLLEVTGQALADYLRHRPAAESRALFLRLRPPVEQSAGAETIRGSIRNAARRCGLSSRLTGPHRLRHTLATRLVRSGSSIKDVSDLLRHRDLDTTTIYAKVDLSALSAVSASWPGAGS